MSVVSNSSPLINLARVGRMDILRQLYGKVVIPEAVWNEVVVQEAGQPGADEVREAPWIVKRSVRNRELVLALRQELGAGEAEAIALALEIKAQLLLMDEHLGRETAHHLGLRYTGIVGVLIEAKRMGIIETIRSLLDDLRGEANFRISDALYRRVLEDQGEWDESKS